MDGKRGLIMEIRVENVGLATVITPEIDRLDAAEAPEFKGKMVDLINQGHSNLILDLGKVAFMDSSGLGAMLSSLKTVTASGGKMAVVGVGGRLSNLFRLTKLEKIIPVFDSTEEAIKALG